MHITQKSAQNIVNEMKASIHRDINIMDENGVILASTDPARRGKLHQGALAIIREGLDCLTVRQDEPERGIQRGVNLPVTLRGQLEGVIGITGEPEEVAVFGEIIRHMTEIMLEAAYQQEELELLQRSRSLFVENWLFDAQPDWTELQVRGRLLGIDISQPYTVAVLNTGGDEEDTLSLDRVMKRVQTTCGKRRGLLRRAAGTGDFIAVPDGAERGRPAGERALPHGGDGVRWPCQRWYQQSERGTGDSPPLLPGGRGGGSGGGAAQARPGGILR